MSTRSTCAGLGALTLALVAACGGSDPGSGAAAVTLYTCVSDTTIQPVIKRFEKDNPGSKIRLYRAPTGELNARVAGDVRSGGLKADVIWACDPLTMQDYVDQGLIAGWTPHTGVPAKFRTDRYVGVAVLYMVAVSHQGVPAPRSWSDLTRPVYADGVAVPDPGLAASALGALGYFDQNPGYGTGFYSALKHNGAVQVSTPDDVTTGVAEGTYKAGVTIANSAYAAKEGGSPIAVTWPAPGAVAVYGPVGLTDAAGGSTTAKDFLSYVTSRAGQRVIADAGSYPTLPGVAGPTIPPGAPVVAPDWPAIGSKKNALLAGYQRIFGG